MRLTFNFTRDASAFQIIQDQRTIEICGSKRPAMLVLLQSAETEAWVGSWFLSVGEFSLDKFQATRDIFFLRGHC